MQVKHGKLLPRVEVLCKARAIESYVAEQAIIRSYQPPGPALNLYASLSFVIGCGLSIVLFMLNNNAHSSNTELALLRSVSQNEFGHLTISIVQSTPRPQRSSGNLSTVKTSLRRPSSPAVFKPVEPARQKEQTMDIKISRIEPQRLEMLVSRAINLASTQSYQSAVKTLLQEYQRGNTNRALLSALGALYSKHRKWKKAALSYARACQNYGANAECFYNLAVSHEHLKNNSKAIAYYKKALEHGLDSFGVIASDVEFRIRELQKW